MNNKIIIYIGADHRGFKLKEFLEDNLKKTGYEVIDAGNGNYEASDDYPDFAFSVVKAVAQDFLNRRGILICGSGVGVDVVANKFPGIRSALAANKEQAYFSRNDDDSNILSLAAEFLNDESAWEILEVWLKTPFSGEEKHKRRLEKIKEIENNLINKKT
ncbi:MAG: RpiB/LacA/LacB family sugar-phosphate isomerase [Patescibacteria group bacterium]